MASAAEDDKIDIIYGYASIYDTGCGSRADAMNFLNQYVTNTEPDFNYDVKTAFTGYKSQCDSIRSPMIPDKINEIGEGDIVYNFGKFKALALVPADISIKDIICGVYEFDSSKNEYGYCPSSNIAITSYDKYPSKLYIPPGLENFKNQLYVIEGVFEANVQSPKEFPDKYIVLMDKTENIPQHTTEFPKNCTTCSPKIYIREQFRQTYWTTRKATGFGLFAALIAYDKENDSGASSGGAYLPTAYVDAMFYLTTIPPKIPYQTFYRWEEIDWEYIPQDTGSGTPTITIREPSKSTPSTSSISIISNYTNKPDKVTGTATLGIGPIKGLSGSYQMFFNIPEGVNNPSVASSVVYIYPMPPNEIKLVLNPTIYDTSVKQICPNDKSGCPKAYKKNVPVTFYLAEQSEGTYTKMDNCTDVNNQIKASVNSVLTVNFGDKCNMSPGTNYFLYINEQNIPFTPIVTCPSNDNPDEITYCNLTNDFYAKINNAHCNNLYSTTSPINKDYKTCSEDFKTWEDFQTQKSVPLYNKGSANPSLLNPIGFDSAYNILPTFDSNLNAPNASNTIAYYNENYLIKYNRKGRATSFGHFVVPKGKNIPGAEIKFKNSPNYSFSPLYNDLYSSPEGPMINTISMDNKGAIYYTPSGSTYVGSTAWNNLPGPVEHIAYNMHYDKTSASDSDPNSYFAYNFNWYLILTTPKNVCHYIVPYSKHKNIQTIITDINTNPTSIHPIKCEASSESNPINGKPDNYMAVGDKAVNSTIASTNGTITPSSGCSSSPIPAECAFTPSQGEINRASSYFALLQQWILMNVKSFSGMPWSGMWQKSYVSQFYTFPYDVKSNKIETIPIVNLDMTSDTADNWLYDLQKNFALNVDVPQFKYGTSFSSTSKPKALEISFYDSIDGGNGDLLKHQTSFNSTAAFLTLNLPNDINLVGIPSTNLVNYKAVFPNLATKNSLDSYNDLSVVNGLQIKTIPNAKSEKLPFCTYNFAVDGSAIAGGSYFMPYGAKLEFAPITVDFSKLDDDKNGLYNCLGNTDNCSNGCTLASVVGTAGTQIKNNVKNNELPVSVQVCKNSIRQYCLLSENSTHSVNLNYDHLEKLTELNQINIIERPQGTSNGIFKSTYDSKNNNIKIYIVKDKYTSSNGYRLRLSENYSWLLNGQPTKDIDATIINFNSNPYLAPENCEDNDNVKICTFDISNALSEYTNGNHYFYYQIVGESENALFSGGFFYGKATPKPSTKCTVSNLTANPSSVIIDSSTKITISATVSAECNDKSGISISDTQKLFSGNGILNNVTISWTNTNAKLSGDDVVTLNCTDCQNNTQPVTISTKSVSCSISISPTNGLSPETQTFTPGMDSTTFTLKFEATNCSSYLASKNSHPFVLEQINYPPPTIASFSSVGTIIENKNEITWNVSSLTDPGSTPYMFQAACNDSAVCKTQQSNIVTITSKAKPVAKNISFQAYSYGDDYIFIENVVPNNNTIQNKLPKFCNYNQKPLPSPEPQEGGKYRITIENGILNNGVLSCNDGQGNFCKITLPSFREMIKDRQTPPTCSF